MVLSTFFVEIASHARYSGTGTLLDANAVLIIMFSLSDLFLLYNASFIFGLSG